MISLACKTYTGAGPIWVRQEETDSDLGAVPVRVSRQRTNTGAVMEHYGQFGADRTMRAHLTLSRAQVIDLWDMIANESEFFLITADGCFEGAVENIEETGGDVVIRFLVGTAHALPPVVDVYTPEVPDPSTLVFAATDDTFRFYSFSAGEFTVLSSFTTSWAFNYDLRFSSDGTYLASKRISSPYVAVVKQTSGAWSELTVPAGYGISNGLEWSPDDVYLAAGGDKDDGGAGYVLKRSGDTFSNLGALPAEVGVNSIDAFAWTPDGAYLVGGSDTAPYLHVFSRSGDVFTLAAGADVSPGGAIKALNFDPTGAYMAVGLNVSPWFLIYSFSAGSLTKLTLTGVPAYQTPTVAYSPTGTYVAAGLSPSNLDTTDRIIIWKESGGAFTKLAGVPSTDNGNPVYEVRWSSDGNYLFAAYGATPYLATYERTGDAFAKISGPTLSEVSLQMDVAP